MVDDGVGVGARLRIVLLKALFYDPAIGKDDAAHRANTAAGDSEVLDHLVAFETCEVANHGEHLVGGSADGFFYDDFHDAFLGCDGGVTVRHALGAKLPPIRVGLRSARGEPRLRMDTGHARA